MRSASEIRSQFTDFFRERDHRIVPSAPVFPQDDPTLLFTNAGMNQFKDVFLGTGRRPFKRAADTQKCIRVSGKHNDLEEVGRDTYHHTFFEMLGNWSFGDYFKREAIAWAWELLTEVWHLPKDRLWATVFRGDATDGLEADHEARALWREVTDIDPSHILEFGRKDNFWEMGESGPCGPCTEIHIDRGPADSDPEAGRDPRVGVNAGNERFIELWNLVFIQFNRKADGSLEDLPARHVDTGMGFERVTAVLQGRKSNYDTDLFTPIFDHLGEICGRRYEASEAGEADIAFRVIADHVRALSVALADGALPGNEGRGYVLRRLLRRAARFGRQSLEVHEPFIFELVPTVAGTLRDAFPEIGERQDHIAHLIESEERAFGVTLDKGIDRFEELATRVEKAGSRIIDGGEAYDLYATYGFPMDLVELMARERDLEVDEEGWKAAEDAHRSASRKSGSSGWRVDPGEVEGLPATEIACYSVSEDESAPFECRPLKLIDGRILVLDRTPFYAESGGQVGDRGTIRGEGFAFEVADTQKMGDVILHMGKVVEGEALPDRVTASVDRDRRLAIMANHTGTHLLHWALKEVLGPHANQQGSLVAPDRLRFDVTHPRAITWEEIEEMERLVNEKIVLDLPLGTTVEELEAARARGVTALFGEKYDERVRVVDIGGFSTELCGGTHCRSTGQIGALVILGEAAVQAGVRRIEAVTRGEALRRLQDQRRLLREASHALKTAEAEIPARIGALHKQIKELRKGGAQQSQNDLGKLARALVAEGREVGDAVLVSKALEGVGHKELTLLCDALRAAGRPVCGVLGLVVGESKVMLAAFASPELAGKRVHAGKVVKEIAPLVGGGGGGRPDFAQAGGKNPATLQDALAKGADLLAAALTVA
jgi:alanyl-tRNA synthetase